MKRFNALVLALGLVMAAAPALASYPGPVLPISQGGSGSATKVWCDLTTGQSIAGAKTFSDAMAASTSVAIGGGTALTKCVVYTPTLTPASVAANTTAAQTFTVTGLTTADTVCVAVASIGTGVGIVGVYASGPDTLTIVYVNATSGSLTPTSTTYRIVAWRS